MILFGWLVIGVVAAVAAASFLKGNGVGPPMLWSIIAGAIGGFAGGYLGLLLSPMIFGAGPEFIVSLTAAAVGGAISAAIVRMIKK